MYLTQFPNKKKKRKNIQGGPPRKKIMTEIWWKLIIFGM